MDSNRPRRKNNKDSAEPSNLKKLPTDLTDVTIVGTPLPQATSTVDRRSLVSGKSCRSNLDEPTSKHRQLNFNASNDFKPNADDESSLGILQFDMSSCTNLLENDCSSTLIQLKNKNDSLTENNERELAFELIKKHAKPSDDTFSKSDKENNVNSTNLPDYNHAYIKNVRSSPPKDRKTDNHNKKSTNNSSIIFDPSEMTGRSSEWENSCKTTPACLDKSRNVKKETLTGQNFISISYNSKLMEQFGDEEFMSGSKVGNQMLADEMSWRKNQLELVPVSETGNDRLEFSCFSGIMGSADLTVEDGRISVGEFFQRKCGTIGHLSINSTSERPSIGLGPNMYEKQGKCRALVDQRVTSEVHNLDETGKNIVDCTKDSSVMSLSCIAKALQEGEDITPTKLIDELMEKNKKTKKVNKITSACKTYTVLPGERSSLPATTIKNKAERDKTRQNHGYKLSLDSRNISQTDNETFDEILSTGKITDQKLRELFGMENYKDSQDVTLKSSDCFSLQQNFCRSDKISIPRADSGAMPSLRWKLSQLPCTSKSDSFKTSSNKEVSSLIHDTDSAKCNKSEPTLAIDDSTIKDKTLTSSCTSPPVRDQSFNTRKVQVGKKTQEVCTCLVGLSQEADFELCNGTDRWIVCKLQLFQIQGEKDNIQLTLPNNDILIKPDEKKCFKIGVKMIGKDKLIVAVLHIPCLDMVTKNSWLLKHVMCFMPEEPDIKISIPSDENVLDFQMITEDTSNSIPITLENKNSINVPVLIRLNQDEPELFSIIGGFNKSLNDPKKQVYLVLEPKVPFTINIEFRGMSLQSFREIENQKGVYSAEAKLSISVCFKENEEHPVKEIKLKGFLGSCKLDIVDTHFPLVLQPKIVKSIIVKNSGNIVVTATVNVVQSEENQSECRDFSIYPNNVILNGGDKLALQITFKPENDKTDIEKHAIIRIVVGNTPSFYPVIGEKIFEEDCCSNDNLHHPQSSETLQRLQSVGSSTSPQSSCFNRSGTPGRQSPCSTASGGTAMVKENMSLKATHLSLVWGSIKIGKSDTQQFTVRNTGNSKLKLFVSITSDGRCFKFSKERGSSSTSMVISLQAMESKTLFVVFSPAFAKAVTGKIIFSHYNSLKENRELSGFGKVIPLFGYGGCGKIEIFEAVKDTSEQMWLSLGNLNSDGVLHSKIRLQNRGDLTGFVKAKIIPKALCPSVESSWHIKPNEILLPPKQTQSVLLEFRPKKDDFPQTHRSGVIHVGTLRLIYGDEPTRLRIRRLYKKLQDSVQLNRKIDCPSNEFKEVIHQISKAFPNEAFVEDLQVIKDSEQNLGDLCKGIVQKDIKLTVEIPSDETIFMFQDSMEDSETFYSLCSNQENTLRFGGESFLPPK